jgi:hypothetical protein
LNLEELDLNERVHAFHCEQYAHTMLAMLRDASSPEQQAEIERSYFATTGKSLQDVLEQCIIAALEAKYPPERSGARKITTPARGGTELNAP